MKLEIVIMHVIFTICYNYREMFSDSASAKMRQI